jgi:hypothetical protein
MNTIDKIKLLQPVCYLNSDEKYFPMLLETYLQNCKLKKNNTLVDLDLVNENYKDDKSYQLIPQGVNNNPDRNSVFFGNPNINDIPYIVKINNNNDNTINIIFFFFFGYNGAVTFPLDVFRIGNHYSDIEHITIKVNADKFNNINNIDEAYDSIISVYYSEHSGGRLIQKKDLEIENNRVVAYLANRTHASYPKAGLYFRFYGFGNDHAEKYFRWLPNNIFIIDLNDKPIINNFIKQYKGDLGFSNVSGFASKSYFNGGDEKDKPEGIHLDPKIYNFSLLVILFILIFKIFKEYSNNNINFYLYIIMFIIVYNLKMIRIE